MRIVTVENDVPWQEPQLGRFFLVLGCEQQICGQVSVFLNENFGNVACAVAS